MAKESLFNILENNFYLEDVKVLDLYSGTGSIAYEFASRESPMVVAIDINGKCIRYIAETAKELGFENLKTVRTAAASFLKFTTQKFDVIFADPPYDMEGIEEIAHIVFERNLLEKDGWLIIEHSKNHDFTGFSGFFQQRHYGRVNFSIFK